MVVKLLDPNWSSSTSSLFFLIVDADYHSRSSGRRLPAAEAPRSPTTHTATVDARIYKAPPLSLPTSTTSTSSSSSSSTSLTCALRSPASPRLSKSDARLQQAGRQARAITLAHAICFLSALLLPGPIPWPGHQLSPGPGEENCLSSLLFPPQGLERERKSSAPLADAQENYVRLHIREINWHTRCDRRIWLRPALLRAC